MAADQDNTQPFLFAIETHHYLCRNEHTTHTFHLPPRPTFADVAQLFSAPHTIHGRQYDLDVTTLQVSRSVGSRNKGFSIRSSALFNQALARMAERGLTGQVVVWERKDSIGQRILKRFGLGSSGSGSGTGSQQGDSAAQTSHPTGDRGNDQDLSGVQTEGTGAISEGDGRGSSGTAEEQTSNTGQVDNGGGISNPFGDDQAISAPSSVTGSASHPPSIASTSQGFFHPGPLRPNTGYTSIGTIRSGQGIGGAQEAYTLSGVGGPHGLTLPSDQNTDI
jgi:hypothetical protein